MKLSDDKKAAMFKKLASSTLYDVGIEFGLDKHYKDATSIRNKMYAIYRQVANEPEKYAIQPEVADLVVESVSGRKVATRQEPKLAEKNAAIATQDVKALTLSGRDAAGRLIAKKLEYLEAHPRALQQESLVNLGKIFGILFDKGQILTGQATEHVAVLSKIDSNMSPEEAMQAVLKMREANQAEKHG